MYDYIDIHSHLNFSDYDADRAEVINELRSNKIATITIGTHRETSKEAVALADKYPHLYASIGLHPVDKRGERFDEKDYEKLVAHPKVVAIGECGLDYALLSADEAGDKRRQKEDFERQIDFAMEHDLPLMMHCRDAYMDALPLLESIKKDMGDKLKGNFHFFNSSVEVAKKCLELGFTVSFTGPITFAGMYEELVRFVPLEKMMVETDSPYAAPAPYRGKRNKPVYIKVIVESIAKIKGLSLDKVREQLANNATEMFLKKNLTEG